MCGLTSPLIVRIVICAKFLSQVLQLSRQIQILTTDLVQEIDHIDEVEDTVVHMRESGYVEVIQTAKRLCQQVNLRLEMLRLISGQRRPNDVAAFAVE